MLLPKMSHYTCIVTYLSYLFFKPIQSKLLLESLSFVKSNFKGCSQSQQVQCFKYFKTYNISCLNAYQKCFDIVELIFTVLEVNLLALRLLAFSSSHHPNFIHEQFSSSQKRPKSISKEESFKTKYFRHINQIIQNFFRQIC